MMGLIAALSRTYHAHNTGPITVLLRTYPTTCRDIADVKNSYRSEHIPHFTFFKLMAILPPFLSRLNPFFSYELISIDSPSRYEV